jgi:hypothetical protein
MEQRRANGGRGATYLLGLQRIILLKTKSDLQHVSVMIK